MTARREVDGSITSADSIVFTDCHGLTATPGHAPAPSAAGRRRDVVVNGRRVKTVDVHAHCAVPEAMALLGQKVEHAGAAHVAGGRAAARDGRAGHRRRGAQHQRLLVQGRARRGAEADRAAEREARRVLRGAPRALRRPSPRWRCSIPTSRPSSSRRPSRSSACAAPPSGGSVNGEELADPKFHPFWAKVEELGVLVFIHPQGTPELRASSEPAQGQRRAGQRDRQSARDDDRALAPHLRGHARSVPRTEDLRGARRRLPALVRGTLGRRLRDLPRPRHDRDAARRSRPSISGSSTTTRSSSRPRRCAIWWPRRGSGQIVMGTDYPFPWTKTSVDHILGTPGLTDDERIAMLGGTAARLLGIKG